MALKLMRSITRPGAVVVSRQMASHSVAAPTYHEVREIIGTREIVGHGINGRPTYVDREDVPFPAIRFRKEDSTMKAIREKEKGDWKKLTTEEKKALYRFSYCQTFAEMSAPTAEWKFITGWTLIGCVITYIGFVALDYLLPYDPRKAPLSEYGARVLSEQKKLDMGQHRSRDLGPYWDIEARDWKK